MSQKKRNRNWKDNKKDKRDDNAPELVIKPILNQESQKRPSFLEILAKLSPGKKLRSALEDIKHARTGALIAISCSGLREVFEGGFRVSCRFTSQKLAELAKMDGAIILSPDLKKILFANTLLVPNNRIPTNETGTRHKAAERTSKQLNTPVIAVSERRGTVTLYYENKKYVLQDSENLLRRATENLHILEKQREILNDLITNLNILETTNLVSIADICSILQRMEIFTRVMSTLKRYIIELGKEGVIIQMRIRELFKGIEELQNLILKDYTKDVDISKRLLASINFDGLLDIGALARIIFAEQPDKQMFPKGYRILQKLNLTEREINELIAYFKNLGNLLSAPNGSIEHVLKFKAASFKSELENLREQIMIGKKI